MTRTKIALAAALLIGTATGALAQNPAPTKRHQAAGANYSAPVRTNQNPNMSMMPNGNLMMNIIDRASSPFACGG